MSSITAAFSFETCVKTIAQSRVGLPDVGSGLLRVTNKKRPTENDQQKTSQPIVTNVRICWPLSAGGTPPASVAGGTRRPSAGGTPPPPSGSPPTGGAPPSGVRRRWNFHRFYAILPFRYRWNFHRISIGDFSSISWDLGFVYFTKAAAKVAEFEVEHGGFWSSRQTRPFALLLVEVAHCCKHLATELADWRRLSLAFLLLSFVPRPRRYCSSTTYEWWRDDIRSGNRAFLVEGDGRGGSVRCLSKGFGSNTELLDPVIRSIMHTANFTQQSKMPLFRSRRLYIS